MLDSTTPLKRSELKHEFEFPAIGTKFWVEFSTPSEYSQSQLDSIENECSGIAEEFDQNYSRFRKDSKLGAQTKANLEYQELLDIAATAKKATKGLIDTSVGGQLSRLGYDANYSFQRRVELSETEEKLPDFGSFGKGFLIDKIFKWLRSELGENNYSYLLVNGGGDLLIDSKNSTKPKEFTLEDPRSEASVQIGRLELGAGALAATAPNKRSWNDNETGRLLHHIIDPKTGEPVQTQIAGVFTRSKTATVADLTATALFLADPDMASVIADFYKVEFLLLFKDGSYFESPNFGARMNQ